MINSELAASIGIGESAIPQARLSAFKGLASQTSLQERECLYAISRYFYSGEGGIWDIGCAAGGSTFCLAAGVQDNESLPEHAAEQNRVTGFDLFDGYSGRTFKNRFGAGMSDLELFQAQTASVSALVLPRQLDLVTELDAYQPCAALELVHIDAAKSLPLWQSIFRKIGPAVIPGKTVWIYQDFERSRLPWQVYTLADLMQYGSIIGGASLGTVYFRFDTPIADDIFKKIVADDYSLEEKVDKLRRVYAEIRQSHTSFFSSDRISINDLENTALAYCHYWSDDRAGAKRILSATTPEFLAMPGHGMYAREILAQDVAESRTRRVASAIRRKLGAVHRSLKSSK